MALLSPGCLAWLLLEHRFNFHWFFSSNSCVQTCRTPGQTCTTNRYCFSWLSTVGVAGKKVTPSTSLGCISRPGCCRSEGAMGPFGACARRFSLLHVSVLNPAVQLTAALPPGAGGCPPLAPQPHFPWAPLGMVVMVKSLRGLDAGAVCPTRSCSGEGSAPPFFLPLLVSASWPGYRT